MADATIATTVKKYVIPAQGRRFRSFKITVTGNYRTGGLALTAADLGLKAIDFIMFEPAIEGTSGSSAVLLPQYDRANAKVLIYTESSGAVIVDNTDISTTVLYGFVAGY